MRAYMTYGGLTLKDFLRVSAGPRSVQVKGDFRSPKAGIYFDF